MKGRPLIFFFLISLFLVHPVYAEDVVTYDFFNYSGESLEEIGFISTSTWSIIKVINSVQINDIVEAQGLNYIIYEVPTTYCYNMPLHSDYDTSVTLTVDGDVVGTGIYGYSKSGDESTTFLQLHIWEGGLDIGDKTGAKTMMITTNSLPSLSLWMVPGSKWGSRNVKPSSSPEYVYFSCDSGSLTSAAGVTTTLTVSNDYEHSYPFSYTSSEFVNLLEMGRDSTNTTKAYITSNGVELLNETTLKTTDLEVLSYDKANYTWQVDMYNMYDDVVHKSLVFSHNDVSASGEVNFNQSYFTSPDVVGVEYDIENFDLVNDEYWILLTGTNNGIKYFVTTDYYDITTATGQDDFSISYHPLTLPFTMQAELWRYSRVSGVSSVLAYSPLVEYNPSSLAPGSIWTEKDNYNISEIFYIQFDTNYNSVQIELISSDFYDLRTMEGPGLGHLGYLFNDPHNFTAYLIEGGIKTNYTDFTVSADAPFLNIHVDTVPVNQGFCFSYYTDNTSDTITGYRPDGSIFYGPTTNLITLEKVDICGPSSSSPAGIYTMSLLHDGADYYNDTIVMTSANEYIYFESSKYETGDRMIIHYYIMDRQQRIRLSDSLGTAVVTWTCDAFYITPNMGNSLWFSLIDNNEYGLNMNASIDAGTFRTGNWKVEIIGIDGKPLTDYDTYDYTTVNKKIETSEDQTTAFLLLICSPEGLFLIFTSVLMLAGLVAAKHPAGGAAGAAVGVGFGVFFGVLPVWLLFLMVILLVVLAGVGTAVYFKGK